MKFGLVRRFPIFQSLANRPLLQTSILTSGDGGLVLPMEAAQIEFLINPMKGKPTCKFDLQETVFHKTPLAGVVAGPASHRSQRTYTINSWRHWPNKAQHIVLVLQLMPTLDEALASELVEDNVIGETKANVGGLPLHCSLQYLKGIWEKLVITVEPNSERGFHMLYCHLQCRTGTTVRLAKKSQPRVLKE